MLCRRFRHAGNDQDLKEHAYGGPAGIRTRVQNTFCFASYSDNTRMAFRLTPTVLGVVGSSRDSRTCTALAWPRVSHPDRIPGDENRAPGCTLLQVNLFIKNAEQYIY